MSNKKIKCQPKTRIVLKPHRNVAMIRSNHSHLSKVADYRVRKTGGVLVLESPTKSVVFGPDALDMVSPGSKVNIHNNTMGRAQASAVARALKGKGAVINLDSIEKKEW